MQDNEKYYDEVIEPMLFKVGKLCEEKRIPFLATVEYAPEMLGTTGIAVPEQCLAMTMIKYCTNTAPNIDSYILGLSKYCKESNIDTSASLVMRKLFKEGN